MIIMMDVPKGSARNTPVDRALNHLQQAEFELLAALRPESPTSNADLLEVHAPLWDAIALLAKVISDRRTRD
ncbi:MAG TPA: hypothetical protein VMD78_08170 [Candidatus Baltobacteraceae bacterium]|nr:hypothetical protein [Candidatus Baltobacteraceae bacterium]